MVSSRSVQYGDNRADIPQFRQGLRQRHRAGPFKIHAVTAHDGEHAVGADGAPNESSATTNSRMVQPLEMRATREYIIGPYASHQAQ